MMHTEILSTKKKYLMALEVLKPFCKRNIPLAFIQTCITLFALISLALLSNYVYEFNAFWSVLIAPFITMFLCRSYVIEHDCGHQSFFRKKSANAFIGNIFGFLNLIPYEMWKYIHDCHHNNVGNLDKRHLNPELWTLTLSEYKASSKTKKWLYRMIRSKAVQLIFAPPLIFGIIFRIPHERLNSFSIISVIVYDIFYITTIYFLLQIMPVGKLLVIYGLPLYMFWVIASYVFYAQHQFEDTYWETQDKWSYEEATFLGSTYLTSPGWFNWVSGNVGYHNIHHLISSIPNYNLEKAQHALEGILEFKPISIFKVYGLFELKLWDEERRELVKFPDTKVKQIPQFLRHFKNYLLSGRLW